MLNSALIHHQRLGIEKEGQEAAYVQAIGFCQSVEINENRQ